MFEVLWLTNGDGREEGLLRALPAPFVTVSQAASGSRWLMFSMNEMLAVRPGTALVLSGFECCIVSFLGLWLDNLQRGSRMMWETPSPDTSE